MRQPARVTLRAVLALVLAGAWMPGVAQRTEPLPADLEGVGVTQRLDESVPLDLRFRDEAGNDVRLGDYFDSRRPVLLSLVYYDCPMLCTLVLDGMVRVLQGMDWVPGQNFEVITLSIDPHETPDLARQKKDNYLASYGRPEAATGWHFLTGDEDQIRALADAVGFRYRYLEQNGEFAHPAALFVLTPEGRISRYLFGVQHDPGTLRLSLVEASEGRIGTPVDKFLLYCYRYDAEAGTYAPVAMQIMRLGGGATAVVVGGVLLGFWLRDSRRRSKKGST